jgi:hypothetical protein
MSAGVTHSIVRSFPALAASAIVRSCAATSLGTSITVVSSGGNVQLALYTADVAEPVGRIGLEAAT